MSEAMARYDAAQRPEILQEALNNIGSWMLEVVKVEDGWNKLVLDIKPLSDTVFVRITESRDEGDAVGSAEPVQADSPVLADIEKLQHAAFREGEGSWFTASVVVTATGWPNPTYQTGASYDWSNEPQNWSGEGSLSGRDIRAHFEIFPRSAEHIPQWAQARLAGRRGKGTADGSGAAGQQGANPYLDKALDRFVQDRSEMALANVVRSAQGGNLVMDVSPSVRSETGETQMRYQVLRLANGMRALTAYSSEEAAQLFAQRGGHPEPQLRVEPAMKVFLQVANDESIDVLVFDPGSPRECFIEKPQVQWAIGTPHNEPAKRALVDGNMHDLLAALTAPAAVLLLGVRRGDSAGRPVFVREESGQESRTALVFTSATEVAALDPNLEVRTASAVEVLKLLAASEAETVRINALSPYATLPMEQVRELISIVESQ
ncbi:MAG: SseB family protein [Rothia sp. (in: high G+C Gram-positive bacteria)]|nr:SseB family protein [Rothia sp. (in: high G+C Gram-positive bacteria)]